MGRYLRLLQAAVAVTIAAPVYAQNGDDARHQAAGAGFSFSRGSGDTEVSRAEIYYDFSVLREDKYVGVSVERIGYRPGGDPSKTYERIFLRAGEPIGEWQLRARVGTDGDNVIGSLSINDQSRFRKEFFVERDLLETRQGLARGLYSTFAGAAIDLPLDDRNTVTALAGIQEFTGRNMRLHLRGNYIHIVKPEWGASLQLRSRWFRDGEPGEFDYYSPRWYAEILPVAQVRRFTDGWEILGAAGFGVQRDSTSDWRASHYVHARVRSPATTNWRFNSALTFRNTPGTTGNVGGYQYTQIDFGLMRVF
jgi:hypothetical protein